MAECCEQTQKKKLFAMRLLRRILHFMADNHRAHGHHSQEELFPVPVLFLCSADAYGVVSHQQTYHIGKEQVILVCSGYNRNILCNNWEDLAKKQIENVAPIVCQEGNKHSNVFFSSILFFNPSHQFWTKFACMILFHSFGT